MPSGLHGAFALKVTRKQAQVAIVVALLLALVAFGALVWWAMQTTVMALVWRRIYAGVLIVALLVGFVVYPFVVALRPPRRARWRWKSRRVGMLLVIAALVLASLTVVVILFLPSTPFVVDSMLVAWAFILVVSLLSARRTPRTPQTAESTK